MHERLEERLEEPQLHLHIHLQVHITGDQGHEMDVEIPIPEPYDAMDARALIVREVEDAAFAFNLEHYGRSASRAVIIAMAARLRALRALLDDENPSPIPLRLRMLAIYERSNEDITAQWGEDPD